MSSFTSAPVPPIGNPRPVSAAGRRLRTTALVLGIAALLTFFIPVLGQLVAIAAIVVGGVALARAGFSKRSIAGIVLGGVSIVLSLLVVIGVVAGGAARSGAPVVAATPTPTATPRSFAQPIATAATPTPAPVVTVPHVVGASYQDAAASLASLGLQAEASRALSAEEAATTSVTAQSHAGEVAPGTTVRLTVADPAPAPAPADPAEVEDSSSGSAGGSGSGSGSGGGSGSGASGSGAGASYANCTEAKAAGAAPLYAGDPGYSSKLDRDGDGVACE